MTKMERQIVTKEVSKLPISQINFAEKSNLCKKELLRIKVKVLVTRTRI